MSFCTAINCMDGRVQIPVINYLKMRFLATYVDEITEAGPVRFFSISDSPELESILRRTEASLSFHGSTSIGVVAHHDCAGNPVPKERHIEQLREAVRFLAHRYPHLTVLGLWVDEHWCCSEVAFHAPSGAGR